MLEDFLVPIYQDAQIISRLKYVVELIREHDDHHAVLELNELLQGLCDICKRYFEWNKAEGLVLWNEVTTLNQKGGDLILVGDIIENNLLPKLQRYMTYWGNICETDEVGLCLETSVSGFLTLKDVERNLYFHSTVDPMEEARKLAKYIYEPKRKAFSVLGCGMGYLIYQLYQISNGSIVINVYESDKKILEYAYKFGVLSWIPEECIRVITDKDILKFLNSIDNPDTGFYLFYPEIDRLPEDICPIIKDLYLHYSTKKKFEKDNAINYYRNVDSDAYPISKFKKKNIKEEVVVVAAGPSLDENIEFLKESKGQKTIVAVGTVFKKLLNLGIEPDVVVIIDPQKRTIKQIEGVENQQIPMIMSIVSYWGFARKYQGKKYLVPSASVPLSEEYAKKHGELLWDCGGTVTSLAMQVAIWFEAKKIYFVGVDLAYPGGISHASGTMDRETKKTDGMTPVVGVGNTTVYADAPFLTYREWIENRIKTTPEIEYINMSKIGARIKGSKEVI